MNRDNSIIFSNFLLFLIYDILSEIIFNELTLLLKSLFLSSLIEKAANKARDTETAVQIIAITKLFSNCSQSKNRQLHFADNFYTIINLIII